MKYFLFFNLFFLSTGFAFSKNSGQDSSFDPQVNLDVSGVWQARIDNPSTNCDYFLFSNKEPSLEETPALRQINGELFSFDRISGKLDKKKIDLKKGEKIFTGLDFSKNQRTILNKLQCEFIPEHGGHPAFTFEVTHTLLTLHLVTIGNSRHEDMKEISNKNLPKDQKDSFIKNWPKNTILQVTGTLFYSNFPKTFQKNGEDISAIKGFINNGMIVLSAVEEKYWAVLKMTTLTLKLNKEKKLEGLLANSIPSNQINGSVPIIFKKMMSLRKE